jgi:hypothetical protein
MMIFKRLIFDLMLDENNISEPPFETHCLLCKIIIDIYEHPLDILLACL